MLSSLSEMKTPWMLVCFYMCLLLVKGELSIIITYQHVVGLYHFTNASYINTKYGVQFGFFRYRCCIEGSGSRFISFVECNSSCLHHDLFWLCLEFEPPNYIRDSWNSLFVYVVCMFSIPEIQAYTYTCSNLIKIACVKPSRTFGDYRDYTCCSYYDGYTEHMDCSNGTVCHAMGGSPFYQLPRSERKTRLLTHPQTTVRPTTVQLTTYRTMNQHSQSSGRSNDSSWWVNIACLIWPWNPEDLSLYYRDLTGAQHTLITVLFPIHIRMIMITIAPRNQYGKKIIIITFDVIHVAINYC